MYKFIKLKDENNSFDIADVEFTVESDHCLDDMLLVITDFLCAWIVTGKPQSKINKRSNILLTDILCACGYRPKGNLEFIEEYENVSEAE